MNTSLITTILAFAISVLAARLNAWTIDDILWAFWTASLFVGYSIVVVSLSLMAIKRAELSQRDSVGSKISGFVHALFGAGALILFFSLHFGLYHAASAYVIQEIFPGRFKIHAVSDYKAVLAGTRSRYWPFLVMAAVHKRNDYFESEPSLNPIKNYASVLKIQLVLMALGFSSHLNPNGLFVSVMAFAIYFFKWPGLDGLESRVKKVKQMGAKINEVAAKNSGIREIAEKIAEEFEKPEEPENSWRDEVNTHVALSLNIKRKKDLQRKKSQTD